MRQAALRSIETGKSDISDGPDAQVDALMQLVGDRVRAARNDLGMSRRELSERSGVSPRYLAQLEGGEGNISIGLLQRIAIAIARPIDALVALDDALTDDLAEVSALYRTADAATRARALQVLDPARQRAEKAQRICLIGLRGAGKSTLGPLIAARFDLPFVELNKEIEAKAGIPIAEIIALYGEEGYRQLEADTLGSIIALHDRLVLAVAGGIVSGAGAFAEVLARFHTVWIKASPAEHMDRVRAQGDLRPMAGNPEAMIQLRQILKAREAHYAKAAYHIDTSGKSIDASLDEISDMLEVDAVVDDPA